MHTGCPRPLSFDHCGSTAGTDRHATGQLPRSAEQRVGPLGDRREDPRGCREICGVETLPHVRGELADLVTQVLEEPRALWRGGDVVAESLESGTTLKLCEDRSRCGLVDLLAVAQLRGQPGRGDGR